MRESIKIMKEHVTVRKFKHEALSNEIKNQLLMAAKGASTSNFVQAYSIIDITDTSLRSKIADISGCPEYVNHSGVFYVFIADLYRHAALLKKEGKKLDGVENIEALMVAIIDATLAAENMAVAAESLGLGICFIGGVRNKLNEVAQLLDLPKYTVPIFGLTIGEPLERNEVKPRLPLSNHVSQNKYDADAFLNLKEYEAITQNYYAKRGDNKEQSNWSTKMVDFFKLQKRQEVIDFLKSQGFKF